MGREYSQPLRASSPGPLERAGHALEDLGHRVDSQVHHITHAVREGLEDLGEEVQEHLLPHHHHQSERPSSPVRRASPPNMAPLQQQYLVSDPQHEHRLSAMTPYVQRTMSPVNVPHRPTTPFMQNTYVPPSGAPMAVGSHVHRGASTMPMVGRPHMHAQSSLPLQGGAPMMTRPMAIYPAGAPRMQSRPTSPVMMGRGAPAFGQSVATPWRTTAVGMPSASY
jgi:hypothetical protein